MINVNTNITHYFAGLIHFVQLKDFVDVNIF